MEFIQPIDSQLDLNETKRTFLGVILVLRRINNSNTSLDRKRFQAHSLTDATEKIFNGSDLDGAMGTSSCLMIGERTVLSNLYMA